MSEQDLVDCVDSCFGCGGGWPYKAIDYVINGSNNTGIDTEISYPYLGFDNNCNFSENKVGVVNIIN